MVADDYEPIDKTDRPVHEPGTPEDLVRTMTLEEMAAMCSGRDFFHTQGLERLGIPSILLSDGPHGLRKQDENADFLGINASITATCFPTEATLACSFDRKLMHAVGEALGDECLSQGVSVLLGPGMNIKRSPLCGRNFEYFSEDPYLTAELAIGYVKGLQSRGVGACVKHFAANNQEDGRLSVDVRVDERTLRELYLAAFERTVKAARPWSVMCAYNKINGTYCSENRRLLTDILRGEWGFEGFVVSDWGAVAHRVEALEAGLDLEMPSSGTLNDEKIIRAVKDLRLHPGTLDQAVGNLLAAVSRSQEHEGTRDAIDFEAHRRIAEQAARESMVLLKNEDGILPLEETGAVAVIGEMARTPRYQGSGSSHVNASSVDNIHRCILTKAARAIFSPGYHRDTDEIDEALIEEAVRAAARADCAVVFAGLIEDYESEGYDRTHLRLPASHERLIEEVAAAQPNTVVVLSNGAPVEMPWIGRAKGLIEMYLGGQALGGAVADILFGDANPCGKLAETFPLELGQNPSFINFPGEGRTVEYREGLFVGYKHYDKIRCKPLFPFGFGLSYTTFAYEGISLDKSSMTDRGELEVTVAVTNTGKRSGKEIVQLYVGKTESRIIRPVKELKGFEKVLLESGETKEISFVLNRRSFAHYDIEIGDWRVEDGEYEITAAPSSADAGVSALIWVEETRKPPRAYTRFSTIGEIMDDERQTDVLEELLACLSVEGALLHNVSDNRKMGDGMVKGMPLCTVYSYSNTSFNEERLQDVLLRLNGTKEKEQDA